MEIVACSGYGKNGAISVLQVSLQEKMQYTFEILSENVSGMHSPSRDHCSL